MQRESHITRWIVSYIYIYMNIATRAVGGTKKEAARYVHSSTVHSITYSNTLFHHAPEAIYKFTMAFFHH